MKRLILCRIAQVTIAVLNNIVVGSIYENYPINHQDRWSFITYQQFQFTEIKTPESCFVFHDGHQDDRRRKSMYDHN